MDDFSIQAPLYRRIRLANTLHIKRILSMHPHLHFSLRIYTFLLKTLINACIEFIFYELSDFVISNRHACIQSYFLLGQSSSTVLAQCWR